MEIVDCLSVFKYNMLLVEVVSDNRGGFFEIGSIGQGLFEKMNKEDLVKYLIFQNQLVYSYGLL